MSNLHTTLDFRLKKETERRREGGRKEKEHREQYAIHRA